MRATGIELFMWPWNQKELSNKISRAMHRQQRGLGLGRDEQNCQQVERTVMLGSCCAACRAFRSAVEACSGGRSLRQQPGGLVWAHCYMLRTQSDPSGLGHGVSTRKMLRKVRGVWQQADASRGGSEEASRGCT